MASCGVALVHYGPFSIACLYRRSKNLFILLQVLRKNTGKGSASDVDRPGQQVGRLQARMMHSRGGLRGRLAVMSVGHEPLPQFW